MTAIAPDGVGSKITTLNTIGRWREMKRGKERSYAKQARVVKLLPTRLREFSSL